MVELLTFLFHKEKPPKLEVVVLGRAFEKGGLRSRSTHTASLSHLSIPRREMTNNVIVYKLDSQCSSLQNFHSLITSTYYNLKS